MKTKNSIILLVLALLLLTATAHAHPIYYNKKFWLFTRCQPVHLHVEVQDVVGDTPQTMRMVPNESQEQSIRAFVESRLQISRIYQAEAQNYIHIRVSRQFNTDSFLIFEFNKLLWDRGTDRWDYATTYGAALPLNIGRATINVISRLLDNFIKEYLQENQTHCR